MATAVRDSPRLSDIHDETLEDRVIRLIAQETRELARRKAEFVSSPCPACRSASATPAYLINGLDHMKCHRCGTIFVSPCPTERHILDFLSRSQGLRIWREEMPDEVKTSRRDMYRRRLRDTLDAARRYGVRPRIVVEIGGGNGEFAEEASRSGEIEKLIVVEPQPLALDLPGVEVIAGDFETLDPAASADIVVAFEVFEHLVDPDRFLAMARRCLAPGGILLMTTPNGQSLEVERLGEKSNVLPFDHVRIYNPGSMRTVLNRAGFGVEQVETPGKLDVQILRRWQISGGFDPDPPLRFILEDERLSARFQDYLRANCLSSHMRILARRPRP